MREYFALLFLSLVVKWRLFVENMRIFFRYYRSPLFRKADLALLAQYLFKSPYKVSKEFQLKAEEPELYIYGETPLTSLDTIVRTCGITNRDTFFELGSGRGRCCLFLACYHGCQAVGIEIIPDFVAKANRVKEKLHLKNVEFHLRDIREADYRGATVLYLYGTCFDEPFLKKLIARLSSLPKGTKIITVSYPLTDYSEHLFEVVKQFEVPFTWGIGDVYLQVRL